VTQPLLSAESLACRRGGRWLFKGLTFELSGSEALHVQGPNGAGKTSLLRVLAGVARPEAGTVQGPEALLYVSHANAQAEELSLHENLAFAATLAGRSATPAALDAALARLGVGAQAASPVRRLSQGQRRRGALALLALPQAPALWLLDEPYNALDLDGVAALDALLAEHRARGGAVLLTAHASLALPALRRLDIGAPAR
jgi:heme exporter protein A